jgi:hypothetical protein
MHRPVTDTAPNVADGDLGLIRLGLRDESDPNAELGTSGPRYPTTGCLSCGSPYARSWATPDGTAQLCPPCATLHGIGCP